MLHLQVTATAGDSCLETFAAAGRLADHLDVAIDFNFNGTLCVAYPGGDAKDGVDNYHKALDSRSPVMGQVSNK